MTPRAFVPRDPNFPHRIRASFNSQGMMRSLHAVLESVHPGEVEIAFPFDAGLTQQHGALHAAALSAAADSACGYAALTLMTPGREVLTVEFKVNFLAPATGERFVAVGRVIRPGRTLTVCAAEVYAERDGERRLIAIMQATMIATATAVPDAGRDAGIMDWES